MFCTKCGFDAQDAKFCPRCGNRITDETQQGGFGMPGYNTSQASMPYGVPKKRKGGL